MGYPISLGEYGEHGMSLTFLPALAVRFGSSPPFTTTDALAAGFDDSLTAQSIGSSLRAAVGRPIAVGGRMVELRPWGFAHGHRRRWRFVLVDEPNEFI
jgi:hypothetical protein